MKILIIKSVFVIALMLLITPLNAQSLKPLSQAKRDSILISIAKKVYICFILFLFSVNHYMSIPDSASASCFV